MAIVFPICVGSSEWGLCLEPQICIRSCIRYTPSIISYLNSKPVTKWKPVVNAARTCNCDFRSPEQCVEMLLKYFLFATLSVVNSCAAFFFFLPGRCSGGKRIKSSREKFQKFFLYFGSTFWLQGTHFLARWRSQAKLLIGAVEPFESVEYLSPIVGASELNLRQRPGLTSSTCQR